MLRPRHPAVVVDRDEPSGSWGRRRSAALDAGELPPRRSRSARRGDVQETPVELTGGGYDLDAALGQQLGGLRARAQAEHPQRQVLGREIVNEPPSLVAAGQSSASTAAPDRRPAGPARAPAGEDHPAKPSLPQFPHQIADAALLGHPEVTGRARPRASACRGRAAGSRRGPRSRRGRRRGAGRRRRRSRCRAGSRRRPVPSGPRGRSRSPAGADESPTATGRYSAWGPAARPRRGLRPGRAAPASPPGRPRRHGDQHPGPGAVPRPSRHASDPTTAAPAPSARSTDLRLVGLREPAAPAARRVFLRPGARPGPRRSGGPDSDPGVDRQGAAGARHHGVEVQLGDLVVSVDHRAEAEQQPLEGVEVDLRPAPEAGQQEVASERIICRRRRGRAGRPARRRP